MSQTYVKLNKLSPSRSRPPGTAVADRPTPVITVVGYYSCTDWDIFHTHSVTTNQFSARLRKWGARLGEMRIVLRRAGDEPAVAQADTGW